MILQEIELNNSTYFMFKLGLIFSIFLVLGCSAEQQSYCERLENTIDNVQIRKKIIDWADENFKNKSISKKKFIFEDRIIPGTYSYSGEFDWSILGFDKRKGRVRVIDLSLSDFSSDGTAIVDSIFLAERSRLGILVNMNKVKDFGLGSDKQYIKTVIDRIGVLCIDADR